MATFCHQIARKKELTINDPSVTRDFLYIDNLVKLLLEPEFNKYKRPKGQALTIGEVASYLTDKLGKHRNLQKTLNSYIKEAKNELSNPQK